MRTLDSALLVIDGVAFGPNGAKLYVGGSNSPDYRNHLWNRGIEVWDAVGATLPIAHIFPRTKVFGFALNPTLGWLYASVADDYAAYPRGYWVVDLNSHEAEPLELQTAHGCSLGVGPDGSCFAAIGIDSATASCRLVVWDQPPGDVPVKRWEQTLPSRRWANCLACDPQNLHLVTHEFKSGVRVASATPDLVIRDPRDGTVRQRNVILANQITQLLWAPGSHRVVARAGASLLVWDTRDWRRDERKVKSTTRSHFTDMTFHPSGRYLAATSNDVTVKFYDTETWSVAKTFTWNIGRLRSVAFSPDGLLAAAGSDTGKVVVWDVDV